jgi:hypothetical protein
MNAANIARAVNLLVRDSALLAGEPDSKTERRIADYLDREIEGLTERLAKKAKQFAEERRAPIEAEAREVKPPELPAPTATPDLAPSTPDAAESLPTPEEPSERVRESVRAPEPPPEPASALGGSMFSLEDLLPSHNPGEPLFRDPSSERNRVVIPFPRR